MASDWQVLRPRAVLSIGVVSLEAGSNKSVCVTEQKSAACADSTGRAKQRALRAWRPPGEGYRHQY